MAIGNSTYLKLSVGATPIAIACQTDVSYSIKRDLVDVACKDFDGFATKRPGIKSASISVSGYINWAAGATANPKLLGTATLAGTLLEVECDTSETDGFGLSGSAYVSEFNCEGPGIEQPVAFSATLEMDGEFTFA